MSQKSKVRDPPPKSDNYHFAIILQTLTNQTHKQTPQLLFNVSLGRQVFQSTKTINCGWSKQNILHLDGQRLNFVVFNYNPQKTQGFVIKLCESFSPQGESIAESPIDCNSFIDSFLQSQNGAFKQSFILGDDFVLEAQVYVQKNRYNLEKLIKTIKSPKKQSQKSTFVLQIINGASRLSEKRDKSVSKQNRFKRASSPLRRSSAERFSRSKTPRRSVINPNKQSSVEKKQASNINNEKKAKVEEREQNIGSKRVYKSVQNQQNPSIEINEGNKGQVSETKKEQVKIPQIEPLQISNKAEQINSAQLQAKEQQPNKQLLEQKINPIKQQLLIDQQKNKKEIIQSAPIKQQTEQFRNKTQNNTCQNNNEAVQTELQSLEKNEMMQLVTPQHKTPKHPENKIAVQQIQITGRMPFGEHENVDQTMEININLSEQSPSSEEATIQIQENKDQSQSNKNQQIKKDYILIREDSHSINADQEICLHTPAVASEQKITLMEIQPIQQTEIMVVNIQNSESISIPVEQSSEKKNTINQNLVTQNPQTQVFQQVDFATLPKQKSVQKVASIKKQQIQEKIVQEIPQVKFKFNLNTVIVICVILTMILIQGVLFRDSEDNHSSPFDVGSKFKEKKDVRKQKPNKKKK